MKTLTTAPNILSTLTLRSTGYNAALQRFEIVYRITRHTIEPSGALDYRDSTIYLRNTPATLDEEGNIIKKAANELTAFQKDIYSFNELMQLSLFVAEMHAEKAGTFKEYLDEDAVIWSQKLIDENEPCPDWMPNETMLAGFTRVFNGVKKRCLYKHVSTNQITPDNTALWAIPGEQKAGFVSKLKNLFS